MTTGLDPVAVGALLGAASAFIVFAIAVLYRVWKGPTMPDRVIAVNLIGSNTVVVMSIAISKFTVERGGVI